MSLSRISRVDFKKRLCSNVDFRGQGPSYRKNLLDMYGIGGGEGGGGHCTSHYSKLLNKPLVPISDSSLVIYTG